MCETLRIIQRLAYDGDCPWIARCKQNLNGENCDLAIELDKVIAQSNLNVITLEDEQQIIQVNLLENQNKDA